MKRYAKIIDENTKRVAIGEGTDTEFYKSVGMEEIEVEQAYDGAWYVKGYAPTQPLNEIKEAKTAAMKAERDLRQELPITYGDKSFDYDKISLQKLNEAKDDLQGTDDKQIWICADNTLTYLTYEDIMAIKKLGKNRSSDLHIQYAKLKYIIEQLETKEEVDAITFDTDTSNIVLEV